MWEIFERDREYLENKYHRTDEPYDSFNRFAYHGYEYDPSTGDTDAEITQGLNRLFEETRTLEHAEAKALAFSYVLDHTRIDVSEHDYFPGFYSWGRLLTPTFTQRWHSEAFAKMPKEIPELMEIYRKTGALDMWADYDHSVPDWDALVELGFAGILERVRKYHAEHAREAELTAKQEAFFRSMELEYEAILRLIARWQAYALAHPCAKTPLVTEALGHLHDGAPQSAYEVLMLVYFYFMLSESVDNYQVRSLLSGFDIMLEPWMEKDAATGKCSRADNAVLMAYFLMQFSAIGNYWGQPLFLGGTGADGESLINDTTYMFLDVYDKLGIYNPKVQLKINRNTPQKVVDRILDMIRRGHNSFVFMCEPGMMNAMMGLGVTYEEARTCDVKGCYAFTVRGGREVSTAPIYLNCLKAIGLTLNNGADPNTGVQIGQKTGSADSFATFDDFYQAFLVQCKDLLAFAFRATDTFETYLDEINPAPMYSATEERALKLMLDAYSTGAKYNNTVVMNLGLATAMDSLMAIRELVFVRRLVTLPQLKDILDRDWEGAENLRQTALHLKHKYGNNDPLTDQYSRAFVRWLLHQENMRPNARGGFYKASLHSALHFVKLGRRLEATPDGRHRGDEFSKNSSPTMGMDKEGATALVQSVIGLIPSLYTEDFCLDIMLHPSATQGEDGLNAMRSLLYTYRDHDGISMQINVLDANTMRDAQAHPERYRNLQVRVCGWNVLWNDLPKEQQDAYILRAENIAD